jgi:hypothetical protein
MISVFCILFLKIPFTAFIGKDILTITSFLMVFLKSNQTSFCAYCFRINQISAKRGKVLFDLFLMYTYINQHKNILD